MDKMIAKIGDLELMWENRDYEDGPEATDITLTIIEGKLYPGEANISYIVDGNELADALHRLGFTGEA